MGQHSEQTPRTITAYGPDGSLRSAWSDDDPATVWAGTMRYPVLTTGDAERTARGVDAVLAWDGIFRERMAGFVPGAAWAAACLALEPALGAASFRLDGTGERPTPAQVRTMMEAFMRLAGLDPREALTPDEGCRPDAGFFARLGAADPETFLRERLYTGWTDADGTRQAAPIPDWKPDRDRIRALLMGPGATTAHEATDEILAKITAMITPATRAKMERDMYLFSAKKPGGLALPDEWAREPFFRRATPIDPADFGPREKLAAFKWFTDGTFDMRSWVPALLADGDAVWCAFADRLAEPAAWAAMCRMDVRNRYRRACALLHPELRAARALVLLGETLRPEYPALLAGYREAMRAVGDLRQGPTGCVLFSSDLFNAGKYLSTATGEEEIPWPSAPAFLGWGSSVGVRSGIASAGRILEAMAEEVRRLDADPTAAAWHALSVRPTGDAFDHGKTYLGASWDGTPVREVLGILAGRALAEAFPASAADVPAALDAACAALAEEYGEETAAWAIRSRGNGWADGFRVWARGRTVDVAPDLPSYFSRFAMMDLWEAAAGAVGDPDAVLAGIRALPEPLRTAAAADMAVDYAPSLAPRSYAALFCELGPARSRRKRACEAAARNAAGPVTPSALMGRLLESVLADVLASSAAAPGAFWPHHDYAFLAEWMFFDPQIGGLWEEAVALLCSLEFRTAWWRKAAPHLSLFQVPFLVLLLKERLNGRSSVRDAAEALDAARRAAAGGRTPGWRLPDADGAFAGEPRPWERPAFNARYYAPRVVKQPDSASFHDKAGEFAKDIDLALQIESDRDQEALWLAKSLRLRASFFDKQELSVLNPLMKTTSALATMARWLGGDGAAAEYALENMRDPDSPVADLCVLWVDATPEGKALTEFYRDKANADLVGQIPDLRDAVAAACFEDSQFAVPEVRAFLRTMMEREHGALRAAREFADEAGQERVSLLDGRLWDLMKADLPMIARPRAQPRVRR
ncbi:MAG: hypothetical protein HY928_06740 [Elusimicrobia bacterium]|nr:hypothetical protein [Elusimicrobiota bacterium]